MRVLLTGNTCFKIANFREGLVRELIARKFEVVVLAPTDPTREKLLRMGCRVLDLPMDRNGTSPIRESELLWRMHRVLLRERPDIVFSYTIKNNIYVGLSCRMLGIPFVPNVTGLGPAFNRRGALNNLVRFLYRIAFVGARAVFFQNQDDRAEFLRAQLVAPSAAVLLPGSGVDLESFAAEPMPDSGDRPTFLLVSRMLWDKGVGLFVDAARQIHKQRPEVKFQLVGPIDTASRSKIPERQLADWNKEGHIDYLGPTVDVRPWLKAADCIVLPSWYREGTPRVLLEAAATGRPVITTDMPGCRDAIVDGVTGILCEPRQLEALVAALERFLELPPSDRRLMGQNARLRAEKHFDERTVIGAYLDMLPKS